MVFCYIFGLFLQRMQAYCEEESKTWEKLVAY